MAVGEYSQGPVPTVFVESPPPPPPPPPRDEKGGVVISRGFLGVLVVLLLGAAIAGTGFYYMQYQGEVDKVATLEKAAGEGKTVLAARDKTIADQTKALAERDKKLNDFTLQYGQIEQYKADAAGLLKSSDEVLARRPGVRGVPDRLKQAPPWREAAEAAMAKYVEDLKREFARIDRPAPGQASDVLPAKPVIVPSGSTPSSNYSPTQDQH